MPDVLLSICIATYNRADWIGETIASIVPQLQDNVELLVLDGASPDQTGEIVSAYVRRDPRVRYVRADTNGGVDQDFDRAVQLARGDHCWLFADDDLIAPDGVARVLAEIGRSAADVIVVDAEVRDVHLRRTLERSRLPFSGRREYSQEDADRLLADTGNALSFIGCAVVRRAWWCARDRASYYGSLFVHVGTIFQLPAPRRAVVLGEPLVVIRLGNAKWSARSFDIWMLMWPALIWGLPGYSDAARAAVVSRYPWRDPTRLLLQRAQGALGSAECPRLRGAGSGLVQQMTVRMLLSIPGPLANLAAVTLLGLKGRGRGSGMYNLVTTSPFAGRISRGVARAFGQSSPHGSRG